MDSGAVFLYRGGGRKARRDTEWSIRCLLSSIHLLTFCKVDISVLEDSSVVRLDGQSFGESLLLSSLKQIASLVCFFS